MQLPAKGNKKAHWPKPVGFHEGDARLNHVATREGPLIFRRRGSLLIRLVTPCPILWARQTYHCRWSARTPGLLVPKKKAE